MNAPTSIKSSWLQDPNVFTCEVSARNQKGLIRFKRFIFAVILIFNLAIFFVDTSFSMVLQKFENLFKQLKFCFKPLEVYFPIVCFHLDDECKGQHFFKYQIAAFVMPVLQILQQEIFRCYFSMPFIMVDHLGKKIVRKAIEVDAFGRWGPPHVEMRYKSFLSTSAGFCSCCSLYPLFMSGRIDHSFYDSAVITLENLKL